MREIIITSSVLILALLILRRLFRSAISRRVQYALWGLVLVRLLVPASLPAVDFNVMTATQSTQTSISSQLDSSVVYIRPVEQTSAPYLQIQRQPVRNYTEPSVTPSGYEVVSEDGRSVTTYAEIMTVTQILTGIWIAGIGIMACWLLFTNLRFWQKLRKNRTPYAIEGTKRDIWLVENGLDSPCLFGLFRPAIYLTPSAVSDERGLRHVLAHEETHAKHLDPLWSLLRCVCLTVYWFDPLVWIAAIASRTDCELACDEGAIRRLGDDERIAYGHTLLSLVPVRNAPQNPLLSATTMSSDKRKLKERITRIAENRRTVAFALAAVVVVVALVCTVTFTGAAEKTADDEYSENSAVSNTLADTVPSSASAPDNRPVNGPELTYFNELFFNGDYFNFNNQFLSSIYASPEEIDLFELFYNGAGFDEDISDEELAQVGYFDENGELVCDVDKISRTTIDSVLLSYTGYTLEDTSKTGLEQFEYLSDYDAYYHSHGDTNYRPVVTITAGEWKDGLIHLYYEDTFYGGGWKCVTLMDTEYGGYWFVSNLPCEKPIISTVYPEDDPLITIPLDSLTPYTAPAVTVTRHTGDCEKRLDGWAVGDNVVRTYLSTDGNIYAAVIYDEATGSDGMALWDVGCFFTLPDDDYTMYFFSDLFGYNGIVLSYTGNITSSYIGTIYDYYTFSSDGTPSLLARAYGIYPPEIVDLDGDGKNELVAASGASAQMFFQRDGKIYEADVAGLLSDAMPDITYWNYGQWDTNYHRLYCNGYLRPEWDFDSQGYTAFFERYIYFDGQSLLVYKDTRETADHVMEGIDAPDDVLSAAKDIALSQYENTLSSDGMGADDWRIESMSGPYLEEVDGLTIEIWSFNYEIHTTTPELVFLAGGRYITEDAWVSPGYPNCDYLYFLLKEDGSRTYLFTMMENDCVPGSKTFQNDMIRSLTDKGLLSADTDME